MHIGLDLSYVSSYMIYSYIENGLVCKCSAFQPEAWIEIRQQLDI